MNIPTLSHTHTHTCTRTLTHIYTHMHTHRAHITHTGVLSEYVFFRPCDGSYKIIPIEPLVGLTRHPWFCATEGEHITDTSYLYLSSGIAALNAAGSRRAILFDLGAGLYQNDTLFDSQKWFVDTFRKRGVEITDIFAWESRSLSPELVWLAVPAHLAAHYHWYNIAVDLNGSHARNPLNILRQVAKAEDYVILKLNVDHPRLERDIMLEIIRDDSLHQLIDEIYFEHQLTSCRFPPCWQHYPPHIGCEETLLDAYYIYSQLRLAGIFVHSWI